MFVSDDLSRSFTGSKALQRNVQIDLLWAMDSNQFLKTSTLEIRRGCFSLIDMLDLQIPMEKKHLLGIDSHDLLVSRINWFEKLESKDSLERVCCLVIYL